MRHTRSNRTTGSLSVFTIVLRCVCTNDPDNLFVTARAVLAPFAAFLTANKVLALEKYDIDSALVAHYARFLQFLALLLQLRDFFVGCAHLSLQLDRPEAQCCTELYTSARAWGAGEYV